jgi:hypothetical protein
MNIVTTLLSRATTVRMLILLTFMGTAFSQAYAEGTKEVTPPGSQNVGLTISNISTVAAGPYRGAASENRVRFYTKANETFYFGLRAFDRPQAPNVPDEVDVYYRIVNAAGTQQVAPTLIANNAGPGRILTYDEAVNGPDALPAAGGNGYNALTFVPVTPGEFYIEIYQSSDAGATALTDQNLILAFFDFTVADDATSTAVTGRVFSQGWSLITFWLDETNHDVNPTSLYPEFSGDITVAMQEAIFYGYNVDSTVSRITFHNFQPLAFVLYFNKYGVDPNNSNWLTGRRSTTLSGAATSLSNGYPVFLNEPDVTLFPLATQPLAPTVTGISGCTGNYKIDLTTSAPGDIKIFVDRNGNGTYDPGTADFYLYALNVSPGVVHVSWDGLDGLGAPVAGNVSITSYASILRGRTNLPLFDAELNDLGISVEGLEPTYTVPRLYWDDSQLTFITNNIGNCSVNDPSTFNNNVTSNGLDASVEGASQYDNGDPLTGNFVGNRGWDGDWLDGTDPIVPATPDGSKGRSSLLQLCDDFGNFRILNTWFWSQEEQASSASFSTPSGSCVLPVTLVQFTAEKRNNIARLTWVAVSENNFHEYVVERSLNGTDFSDVAHVAGRGGNTRNTYSIDDNISGFSGQRIYYRLRQVDRDNSYRFSRVVVLLTNVQGDLVISGLVNPIRKDFRFQVSTTYAGAADIRIADASGRIVYQEQKTLLSGTNAIELARMPALSPGMYLLSVESNGIQKVQKLFVTN